jgi:hypothetical protein
MTGLIGNRAAIAWVAILGCACAAVALAADSSDAEHSAHAHHAMTDEQLAALRAKIPLFREYPDDAIMATMQRMKNSKALISDAGVRNEVGILALAHGFGEPGNTQFKSALAPVAKVYPTAVGLGMAMMTSGHIQSAIDDLEAAGARTIIVLPTTTGEHTTLVRQWEYIFGLRNDSAYLDVPRVTANAKLVMGRTPTTDPIVAFILADYARQMSTDPANEMALIVAHGPQDPGDNAKELAILEKHAAEIQQATDLSQVRFATLQDDAPTAIRAANVERMRAWVEEANQAGKRVLVFSTLLTSQGGVSGRIRRDLDGLDFEFLDRGLTEHPVFEYWLTGSISRGLKAGQG